jgi:hypothetical protein
MLVPSSLAVKGGTPAKDVPLPRARPKEVIADATPTGSTRR